MRLPFLASRGRLADETELWANIIGSWLSIFLMLLVSSEVLYRFIIGKSILGAIELSELVMVGICSLTLAYTQKSLGHVRVDFLLIKLSGRILYLIESGALFLSFLFHNNSSHNSDWSSVIATLVRNNNL